MTKSSFKPAWWLANAHLQTLWPVFFRRAIKDLPLIRERFELPDGDFIDLDWVKNHNTGPIVVILHGLEGSIESHYAKGMLRAITNRGLRGLFMNFRGCSGEHNRLARSYHSGDTGDLSSIVHALQKREPGTPIGAIGFSLGGNILLKWLGQTGHSNPLSAAAAISVPFELAKTADRIKRGFSRVYQWKLLKCLEERLTNKFQQQPAPFELPDFQKISSMQDFDNQVTALLHGFANASEYYRISSSRQYLDGVRVPTLIVHAKDDPFMSEDIIPEPHEVSEFVELDITEQGGHVGFISGGVPWQPEYWLEERVPCYLAQQLLDRKEKNDMPLNPRETMIIEDRNP